MIRRGFVPILNFLLFSNIFIACCAMAQGALTYLLLQTPPNAVVIAMLGCATLALYNFSLILSKPKDYKLSPYLRVQWFFSHYRFIIGISSFALLMLVPLVARLSFSSIVLLMVLGFIALAYNAPIFRIGTRRFGIRNVPGAKLFIIAAVWACSCVWLPIMELKSIGLEVSRLDTFLLVSKRFLFVMAITLPFDIRDLYQDRAFHLKTIPVMIGERNSMRLCQVLLGIYILFLFIFVEKFNGDVLALTLIALFTGFLILDKAFKKSEYYYFLFLDGTLLLQFAAVYFVNNLS